MQTFPPLCIYNFGLPRRTPSPRPRLDDVRGHGNGGGPSLAGTFPRRRTEVDGAELTRTTTATNDERGLGWAATGAKTWAGRQLAATWPGRRLARTTYVKMARREKNPRGRDRTKKNWGLSPHFGFAKPLEVTFFSPPPY